MTRIPYGKFGLKVDPVGFHVTMPWKGRSLLGEVTETYRSMNDAIMLKVKHFNGEAWPTDVCAAVVYVLPR